MNILMKLLHLSCAGLLMHQEASVMGAECYWSALYGQARRTLTDICRMSEFIPQNWKQGSSVKLWLKTMLLCFCEKRLNKLKKDFVCKINVYTQFKQGCLLNCCIVHCALCIAHCCIPRPQWIVTEIVVHIASIANTRMSLSHSRHLQYYLKIRYIHGTLRSGYATMRNALCNNSETTIFFKKKIGV